MLADRTLQITRWREQIVNFRCALLTPETPTCDALNTMRACALAGRDDAHPDEHGSRRWRVLPAVRIFNSNTLSIHKEDEMIVNLRVRSRHLALCLSALALLAPLGCKVADSQTSGGTGAGSQLSGPPTILAEYQARAPRKCASVKGPPSIAQASALIQCSMDGLTPHGLRVDSGREDRRRRTQKTRQDRRRIGRNRPECHGNPTARELHVIFLQHCQPAVCTGRQELSGQPY